MLTKIRRRLYAAESVNGGRQAELDLAKLVILFFLPFIHCIIECTPEEGLASGIPYLLDTIIGGPLSAPMYMFAMGVGMAYARKNTARSFARRGLILLGINLLLNTCRFLLPWGIGWLLTGDAEKYLEPLPYVMLGNDVLLFAGLAMLLMALFIRLRLPDGVMLGIGLAMSLLGTWLNGMDAGSPAGNIFLGYLIGTEDTAGIVHSYFPLLNWLLIPLCGYVFGRRLIRVKDKRLFYRCISPVCLAAAAIYFAVGIRHGWGMFGEGQNCYYHMMTPDALASLAAAVGMLGVYHLLAPRLSARAAAFVQAVSRAVNAVYCIHWVFVSVVTNVVLYVCRGTQELPVPDVLLLSLAISLVTMLLAVHWEKWKQNHFAGGAR